MTVTDTRPAARATDRGSIAPFIILMLPAFIALAGFAYDAGQVFAGKRSAHNIAAAAARAGANEIDEVTLYAGDPKLDTDAASRARDFAVSQGVTVDQVRILDDRTRVEITVSKTIYMILLDNIGVGAQTATATATAEINPG